MEDYRRRQISSSPTLTAPSVPLSKDALLPPSLSISVPSDSTTTTTTTTTTTGTGSTTNAATTMTSSSASSPASIRRVVLSVSFFCASSLGAIFVNKACLTHYKFSFPSTLMVLQSILTIILLYVLSHPRVSLISITKLKHTHDYRRLMPSTLFFIFNVTIGLSALALVNIPMFSAFRRLTVLFVMLAEFMYLKKTYTRPIVLSVFVLTVGAFISALGDVTFTLKGYMLVFVNNVLTACYLTSIKRIMKELSLDPISLLYYQSLLSFPIILFISIVNGELRTAYRYYFDNVGGNNLIYSPFFLPALTFVAVSAFFVNLSTSVCTHVTSPLTTAVAGQIKNVLQSLLGFFSWGYVPTALNIFGLLVALSGQLAFALFKYRSSSSNSNTGGEERERDGEEVGVTKELVNIKTKPGLVEEEEEEVKQVKQKQIQVTGDKE